MTIRHRFQSALLIAGMFGLAASASAEVHGNRYGRIAAFGSSTARSFG